MTNLDSVLNNSEITGVFQDDQSVLDFHWKGKKFHTAHVTGGSVSGSRFEDCSFTNVTFENVVLDHVDFIRCTFNHFQIVHCSHQGMEIRECSGEPMISQ